MSKIAACLGKEVGVLPLQPAYANRAPARVPPPTPGPQAYDISPCCGSPLPLPPTAARPSPAWTSYGLQPHPQFQAETHLGMFKAETHVDMYKAKV